jgi:hypothetical protein
LWSVALVTVTPPTNTGFSRATGVRIPVRPTWTSICRHLGGLLLRGILVRHRPARLARDEAELALQLEAVHLVHHAVDVERQASRRSLTRGGMRSAPLRRAPPCARFLRNTGRPGASMRSRNSALVRERDPVELAEAVGGEPQRAGAQVTLGSSWRTAPAAALRG